MPETLAFFKLAVAENPDYAYGYFYLCKTYEKSGMNDEAIEAYQRTIDLDKKSRPGIDAAFQIKALSNH